MASSTWVSPEEYERREKYLRAGLREVNLMDPYTWSRPYQTENKVKDLRAGWEIPPCNKGGLFTDEATQHTRFPVFNSDKSGAALMFGLSMLTGKLYDMWNKKPFYFALVPKAMAVATVTLMGFGMGKLREYHYRTRDAVMQHYIELHPEDFDHFQDRSGRPFSQILLPWYPKRSHYVKYD